MDKAKAGLIVKGKRIVCGHWNSSYGHYKYGKAPAEHGVGANYNPYKARGIWALDGCTALSHKVNCVVIED